MRAAFDSARACTAPEADPQWEQAYENLSCDQTSMVIADEKWKCSMQALLNDQQAARWKLRSRARREQGLPAASARQLLFFVLSFHHLGAKHEGENALFALMRLRDKCVQEPLKPGTIQSFLNMWDRIMMQQSAALLSQSELERMFYESVQHAQYGDIQHEIRFYRESPIHTQTQAALRRRIDRVLYEKEVAESRKAAEKALHEQLSLHPSTKRGTPGKQQEPKKEPKKPAKPKATDAEASQGSEDPKIKEALSHSNRQLQAMAAQVEALGQVPIFVKKLSKGYGNGSSGSSSSSSSRSRSPGSEKSAAAKAKEKSKAGAKAKAKTRASSPEKKDLSGITCHKCGKTGHYANKCPENDSSSSGSSRSSAGSVGSADSGTGPINKPCHFHKPWRAKDKGGGKEMHKRHMQICPLRFRKVVQKA